MKSWIVRQGRYRRRIAYVDGKKMYYARYLMEQMLGRKLNSKEVVHHIDGDTLNDDISNLKIISPNVHCASHNVARICTQETKAKMSSLRKGRVISEEWRRKMSIAHMGEKNHEFKHIDTKIIYNYLSEGKTKRQIAKILGISKTTLYKKLVVQGENI